MAINYPGDFEIFGAQLQGLRTIEAVWEYNTKVDGSTYVKDKINTEYSNTVQAEDEAETAAKSNLMDEIAPALSDIHATLQAAVETYFLANYLGGPTKLNLTQERLDEGAIFYEYNQSLLETGQVQISRRGGVLGGLRANMIAASQTIRKNSVSLGAIAAETGNQGSVAESGATGSDHTLSGTIRIVCTQDTVEDAKFSVELILTNPLPGGTTRRFGENLITLGKAYEDGPTGFGITLNRGTLIEAGDDGAIFSSTSVVNPTEQSTNKGVIYIKVERWNGVAPNPDFRVYWYNDAGMDDDVDLVATKDVVGLAGSEVLNISGGPAGGTTLLTTTFDKAAAAIKCPTDGSVDDNITFDLDVPREGDSWTKTVTNSEDGVFATKVARRWPASLNSTANPGQTISDSVATSLSMN